MTLNPSGLIEERLILPHSSPEEEEHPAPLRYLSLGPDRRVAYRHFKGHRQPTLLYVPGFFAHMNLRKTKILEDYAIRYGFGNVRYDQECVGDSTGSQHTIEFKHWLEDALAMIDQVIEGPVILVSSSLGGWVSN